jgi:hypothetical protein
LLYRFAVAIYIFFEIFGREEEEVNTPPDNVCIDDSGRAAIVNLSCIQDKFIRSKGLDHDLEICSPFSESQNKSD